jgi:pimeloyl-ACP methyl ester carboxylesterase
MARSEPVLLVHGWASSFERNWREPGWVDLLSEAGREVIGVDMLGHGSADKPHDPEAYARLEDDVADALPDEGQVDAVGFSLGARVLLRVVASHPDRFARVVVAGVGQNLFGGGGGGRVGGRSLTDDDVEGRSPIGAALSHFAQSPGNDAEALAACLRRPSSPLTAEELGRIACPVLVVIGEKDFAGPAEPLADALGDAKLVKLSGLDHFGTPKDFRFIDAALDFLDAIPT